MAKEKENKEVEIIEDENTEDEKEIKVAKEMAATFAAEMKKSLAEQKEEVTEKVIKRHRVSVKDVPCEGFESKSHMLCFAKEFVPKHMLEKFNNKAALSTYSSISDSAGEMGSLDPIDAHGILASSVALYPSYLERTLQVPTLQSVSTFVDRTQLNTAYVIGESTAITQSQPKFTTRTVTQYKIATLSPVTNTLLRFGTLASVATEVLDSCAQAISQKIQYLLLGDADGTSDTTDGGMTSIPNTINGVASNSAEYTVTGTWSDITNTDISSIVYQTSSWAKPSNFAWICHRNFAGILEGVARTLGGNTYEIQTGTAPRAMLYGYPILFADQMPASASTTRSGLIFGDLSGCCATASTGGTFIDFNEGQWFDQDTSALRVIKHYGQNIYQPGTNGTTTSIVCVNFTSES